MRKFSNVVAIMAVFILAGCATTHYDTLQTRQIESKEFDADMKTTFQAVKTILQDNNYVVNASDYQGGLVTGVGATQQIYDLWYGVRHVSNVVSVNLSEAGPNRTSVRMNIMKRISGQNGVSDEPVVNPDLMQKIYGDINKEILVKQNLNK
jgi:hypothetical protein